MLEIPYFSTETFILLPLLLSRKPRGLPRSKLELGQRMPTRMSGSRFASFSIHFKYTITLQNVCLSCVTVYLYPLCIGYCVYTVSSEQIKEEKVDEQLSVAIEAAILVTKLSDPTHEENQE